MKKLFILSLIWLFAWGCAGEETIVSPKLNVSTLSLNFAIRSVAAKKIDITSNVEWRAEVESGASWCTISQSSGIDNATLEVNVSDNNGYENRQTTITIIGRNVDPAVITVTQLGNKPDIIIENNQSDVNENDTILRVNIVTNMDNINVVIPDDGRWVNVQHVTKTSDQMAVYLKVERNPTFDERQTTIVISAEGATSKNVFIKQKGQRVPTLAFTNLSFEKNMIFTPMTRQISFSVDANIAYTMTIDAEGAWLKNDSQDGENYVFTIEENRTVADRTGYIRIQQNDGQLSDILTIRQSAYSEIISIINPSFDESLGVSAQAGQITFAVEANVNYTVRKEGEFIKEVANSGGNYTFSVDANFSETQRKALIIAEQVGGSLADTLIVIQAPVNKRYSDSLALVAIYHALDMGNWSKTSVNSKNGRPWAFELDKPMDQWGGIRLNKDGRVVRWQVFEEGAGKLHSNANFRFRIPGEIAQLTELTLIQIVTYNFGSFAPEIGNLSKLDTLAFSGDLTGVLPVSIGDISTLKYLSISNIAADTRCQLNGTLPVSLGNLSKLEYLSINRTMVSGNIPSSFTNLSKLKTLSLAANQLEGTIPNGLGTLTNLETVLLFSNLFEGSIPADFDNLKNLKALLVADNYLTGVISAYLLGKHTASPNNFVYCPQNGTGFSNFSCN